ncbi:MAG: lysophospholipase [Miniphocaeibacter sp.]|uniref:alpha/beta hydrolase n=1 Tax=Miniphocaeibacter sp. TaxID=3100973 RepID=UPI0017A6E13C|nr:alpha/beta hydrolase [Gallicola sp.]
MDKYFLTKDSIQLRYREDYISNPIAIVILVHGFAEHIERYDYITKKLNQNNISVFRYDARGHGLSTGKMGDMKSYKEMVDDLYEIVRFVIDNNENIKVFTLGHSMGGNICANFGIKFPNTLAGQLFSGGAFGYFYDVPRVKKQFLKIASRLFSSLYINNPVSENISSDKNVVESYKNDPLVINKATLRFMREFTIKASENIFNNTSKYYYPCFLGHGAEDKVISKEASKRFYNEISSSDKTLKIYNPLYHELFNEPAKDIVIKDYVNWIRQRV